MRIASKTTYYIIGADQEFDSIENCRAYCNEKLAEFIDERLLRDIHLGAVNKLKIFNSVSQLTESDRCELVDLLMIYDTTTSEEEESSGD